MQQISLLAASQGTTGSDTMRARAGVPNLFGLAGYDQLIGDEQNNLLDGGADNDTLTGGAGNDTLIGGTGNDTLDGGVGNDTYRFARGDGQDTITDFDATAGNVDVIEFAAGIASENVTAFKSGNDLILKINGTTDQITVTNHFAGASNAIEEVRFADGTAWDTAKVAQLVAQTMLATAITGTASANWLTGDTFDNLLDGGAGNDTLVGGAGNDILLGGVGNDWLDGGAGDDTYRFARGDGQDIIVDADSTAGNKDIIEFAAGIEAGDVTVTKNCNDLILKINGTTDQITVINHFGCTSNAIEEVRFADGTVWNITWISLLAASQGTAGNDNLQTIAGIPNLSGGTGNDRLIGDEQNNLLDGGADNDTLTGGAGNDTLIGGTGNDTLDGGVGNDTYRFARGDGQDMIFDHDVTVGNVDVIEFASELAPGNITVAKSGNDLILKVNGSTQQVTVQNHFLSQDYAVEELHFANGTVWGTMEIDELVVQTMRATALTGTASANWLTGDAFDNILDGGAGNDTLVGGAGNDILLGGTGNDWLDGGAGDDTYRFAKGDGQDTIIECDNTAGNKDIIEFAAGVVAGDVTVTRSCNDLILKINGTTDKITVSNHFTANQTGAIEEVHFTDGTIWNQQNLIELVGS